jgi:hypothetical protein
MTALPFREFNSEEEGNKTNRIYDDIEGVDRKTSDFGEIDPNPDSNRLYICFFESPYEKEIQILLLTVW